MSRTRGMSIGAVPVNDKVSVDAPRYPIISIVPGHRVSVGVPRYAIISIVPGHRVSVGVPRYTIISIVPGHRVSVGVPRYTNRTEILDTIHQMSPWYVHLQYRPLS